MVVYPVSKHRHYLVIAITRARIIITAKNALSGPHKASRPNAPVLQNPSRTWVSTTALMRKTDVEYCKANPYLWLRMSLTFVVF